MADSEGGSDTPPGQRPKPGSPPSAAAAPTQASRPQALTERDIRERMREKGERKARYLTAESERQRKYLAEYERTHTPAYLRAHANWRRGFEAFLNSSSVFSKKQQLLATHPWFSHLGRAKKRALTSQLKEVKFARGTPITRRGDYPSKVWIVVDGFCEVSTLVEGPDPDKPRFTDYRFKKPTVSAAQKQRNRASALMSSSSSSRLRSRGLRRPGSARRYGEREFAEVVDAAREHSGAADGQGAAGEAVEGSGGGPLFDAAGISILRTSITVGPDNIDTSGLILGARPELDGSTRPRGPPKPPNPAVQLTIATLGPGAVIGWESAVHLSLRTCSVRASSPVTAYELRRLHFRDVLKTNIGLQRMDRLLAAHRHEQRRNACTALRGHIVRRAHAGLLTRGALAPAQQTGEASSSGAGGVVRGAAPPHRIGSDGIVFRNVRSRLALSALALRSFQRHPVARRLIAHMPGPSQERPRTATGRPGARVQVSPAASPGLTQLAGAAVSPDRAATTGTGAALHGTGGKAPSAESGSDDGDEGGRDEPGAETAAGTPAIASARMSSPDVSESPADAAQESQGVGEDDEREGEEREQASSTAELRGTANGVSEMQTASMPPQAPETKQMPQEEADTSVASQSEDQDTAEQSDAAGGQSDGGGESDQHGLGGSDGDDWLSSDDERVQFFDGTGADKRRRWRVKERSEALRLRRESAQWKRTRVRRWIPDSSAAPASSLMTVGTFEAVSLGAVDAALSSALTTAGLPVAPGSAAEAVPAHAAGEAQRRVDEMLLNSVRGWRPDPLSASSAPPDVALSGGLIWPWMLARPAMTVSGTGPGWRETAGPVQHGPGSELLAARSHRGRSAAMQPAAARLATHTLQALRPSLLGDNEGMTPCSSASVHWAPALEDSTEQRPANAKPKERKEQTQAGEGVGMHEQKHHSFDSSTVPRRRRSFEVAALQSSTLDGSPAPAVVAARRAMQNLPQVPTALEQASSLVRRPQHPKWSVAAGQRSRRPMSAGSGMSRHLRRVASPSSSSAQHNSKNPDLPVDEDVERSRILRSLVDEKTSGKKDRRNADNVTRTDDPRFSSTSTGPPRPESAQSDLSIEAIPAGLPSASVSSSGAALECATRAVLERSAKPLRRALLRSNSARSFSDHISPLVSSPSSPPRGSKRFFRRRRPHYMSSTKLSNMRQIGIHNFDNGEGGSTDEEEKVEMAVEAVEPGTSTEANRFRKVMSYLLLAYERWSREKRDIERKQRSAMLMKHANGGRSTPSATVPGPPPTAFGRSVTNVFGPDALTFVNDVEQARLAGKKHKWSRTEPTHDLNGRPLRGSKNSSCDELTLLLQTTATLPTAKSQAADAISPEPGQEAAFRAQKLIDRIASRLSIELNLPVQAPQLSSLLEPASVTEEKQSTTPANRSPTASNRRTIAIDLDVPTVAKRRPRSSPEAEEKPSGSEDETTSFILGSRIPCNEPAPVASYSQATQPSVSPRPPVPSQQRRRQKNRPMTARQRKALQWRALREREAIALAKHQRRQERTSDWQAERSRRRNAIATAHQAVFGDADQQSASRDNMQRSPSDDGFEGIRPKLDSLSLAALRRKLVSRNGRRRVTRSTNRTHRRGQAFASTGRSTTDKEMHQRSPVSLVSSEQQSERTAAAAHPSFAQWQAHNACFDSLQTHGVRRLGNVGPMGVVSEAKTRSESKQGNSARNRAHRSRKGVPQLSLHPARSIRHSGSATTAFTFFGTDDDVVWAGGGGPPPAALSEPNPHVSHRTNLLASPAEIARLVLYGKLPVAPGKANMHHLSVQERLEHMTSRLKQFATRNQKPRL